MQYKAVEQLWEEVGFTPKLYDKENLPLYKMWFQGYIICHMEMLYLKLRDVICINTNIFSPSEADDFINKCCKVYGCKWVRRDYGEIWIVRSDYELKDEIPSRFTDNPLDHKIRGQLLGYSKSVIENYILIQESDKNE